MDNPDSMEHNQHKWQGREKRQAPRIDTSNVVEYTIFNEDRQTLDKGHGVTINLSQKGLLLQTVKPLSGVFVMLMTIDLDGNDIQVEGRLVYSSKDSKSNEFLSGIEFIGPKEKQLQAIVAFVKAYQRRKHMSGKTI